MYVKRKKNVKETYRDRLGALFNYTIMLLNICWGQNPTFPFLFIMY